MAQNISTAEAAKLLGVSPMRVRQFITEGRLQAEKVGRDYILTKDAVEKFKKSDKRQTGRPPKKKTP